MKNPKNVLVILIVVAFSATAGWSQTYKPDWATKIVLPNGGTDPTKALTITAGSGMGVGGLNWILPSDNGSAGGYVLTNDGSGTLTWAAPGSGITLAGDVTGSTGANAIANTAGPHVVAALNNSGVASSLNGDVINHDATLTVSSNKLGVDLGRANSWTGAQTLGASGTGLAVTNNATIGGTLGVTGATTTTGITNSGGLTSTGATNLNTTDALAINIGNGSGNANAIAIGNGSSTTTIAGAVTFSGTVTLPAGSVSASSLALAHGSVFIGDVSGHAAAKAVSGDVTIADDGTTTIGVGKVTNGDLANSSVTVTAGTGLSGGGTASLGGSTTVSLDLTHANTWTGTQTVGGSALTPTTPTALAAGQTNNWDIGSANSYYMISASAAATLTGIANGAPGRVMVLVNTSSNAITLKSGTGSTAANQFHLSGGADIILTQDGSITLIYDGTNSYWRAMATQ